MSHVQERDYYGLNDDDGSEFQVKHVKLLNGTWRATLHLNRHVSGFGSQINGMVEGPDGTWTPTIPEESTRMTELSFDTSNPSFPKVVRQYIRSLDGAWVPEDEESPSDVGTGASKDVLTGQRSLPLGGEQPPSDAASTLAGEISDSLTLVDENTDASNDGGRENERYLFINGPLPGESLKKSASNGPSGKEGWTSSLSRIFRRR